VTFLKKSRRFSLPFLRFLAIYFSFVNDALARAARKNL
jgi:hypothetical protein